MNDIERMIRSMRLDQDQEKMEEKVYPKPTLHVLSEEQIDAIHQKGMITPAEKLDEYDDMDYCPYTNGCSRCSEFENCKDCLIDHVNQHDEWMSFIALAEMEYGKDTKEESKDMPKMLVRE